MKFRTIHANEIERFLKQKNILVIDLREQEEYQKFHLEGAINYPYDERNEWEQHLKKNKMLLLYCDRGNISMKEAGVLGSRGFMTYTLIGGIEHFMRNQIDSNSGKR